MTEVDISREAVERYARLLKGRGLNDSAKMIEALFAEVERLRDSYDAKLLAYRLEAVVNERDQLRARVAEMEAQNDQLRGLLKRAGEPLCAGFRAVEDWREERRVALRGGLAASKEGKT